MPALSCRGFTLLETLLALALGSVVMLAAAQVYPQLRQQSQSLLQRHRLEQALQQVAFGMEKDLRRSGFCQGSCRGQAWFVGQADGEPQDSCVIVAYDLNGNGQWAGAGEHEPEYFGYRLRQGGLEGQRGVSSCQSSGWERLFDPREISVSQFSVIRTSPRPGATLIQLRMAAYWSLRPDIRSELRREFIAANL